MFKRLRSKMPAIGKSLHFRLLFSFTVLTILVVLSTTLIFSSMYINTVNNELTLQASNNLDTLNTEFDNLFFQARSFYRLIKENSDINSFLFFSDFTPLTINHADLYLRQIQYTSPYMYSVILYNQSYDTPIFSGKSGIDIMQFMSSDLKKPAVKSDFEFEFGTIMSNSGAGANQINTTLSIIFNEDSSGELQNKSFVVMNLDREEIEKKLLGKLNGITVVADDNGSVIFNPYNYIDSNSIRSQPYFKKIQEQGEYKGSFRFKDDSDNKLLTYVKNVESGFYIINIESLSSIIKPVIQARTTFIVISALIALVFCLTGYFISSRLSFPIKIAAEKLVASRYGGKIRHMTEIDMITKVFDETTEHMRELENRNEDNNNKSKEDTLRQLLKANIRPEYAKQELAGCGLRADFSCLIHTSLSIDNYMGINESDRLIYGTTLCKIIPEILKDDFICEAVNMFQGEFAVLINFRNSEENNMQKLVSSMDKIRNIASQTLHITLTAGIGGVSGNISESPAAYAKAVEMVKNRFILGQDMTIYKQLLDDKLNTSLSYPFEIEDKLLTAIKTNKRSYYIETLDDFMELLGNYRYSEVISVLFQVTTSCIKASNQITMSDNGKRFLNFDEFSSIFSELQSLEHAKKWMISIFDEYRKVVEQISHLKNDKHYKAVEKMQKYIDKNYQDANLSVELISELAGYTPSYFTRLFKEISGMYVNDYIRQTRINKAKELLSQPDSKVSDIPSAVGFTNLSHFITMFKKDVGLTPSAYRDYCLAKEG